MDGPRKFQVAAFLLVVLGGLSACSSKSEQSAAPPSQPSSAATAPAAPQASQPSAPLPASAALPAPSAAEQSSVIQTQDTNVEGVVGELTECQRSEGVLTVKVRFRNTSSKPGSLTFTHWNASGQDNPKFYVTAGDKKYFMLADSDGTVLSSNGTGNGVAADLDAGKTYLWWAKYPAPSAEAKKINFMTPLTAPFEDVPITDK